MTLSKNSSIAGESLLSLKDCLLYDRGTLDARCIEIWPRIWHELRENSLKNHPTSPPEIDLLIRKLIYNYSHIHQLHRLITKFLEAWRLFESENIPAPLIFPPVLYSELQRCFLDTSEQQMSLILGIFMKEITEQLKLAQNGSSSRLKVLVQLIWTCVRNLRIKTTTRQEVLQAIYKHFVDMKESVLDPLMSLAKKSDHTDTVYGSAVMVHAWITFPLVFRDKFALSMDQPMEVLNLFLDDFQQSRTSRSAGFDDPGITFWIHKLTVLQFTMNDSLSGHSSSALFNWPIVHAVPGNSVWTENPFDVTVETLPIALWDSICTNYALLPATVTTPESDTAFAQFLLRNLPAPPQDPNSTVSGVTLRGISSQFLDTSIRERSSRIHAALVSVLEQTLKDCLERSDAVKVKPSNKKRAKVNLVTAKCTEISQTLTILHKIGLFVLDGVTQFSLSLIWKAFEYVLHSGGHSEEFIQTEVSFANLVLSVPSKDPKYWLNVLWDFCAVRSRILQILGESSVDALNQQTFRLIVLIAESGSAESLTVLFETAKEKAVFILPLILDVLLLRLGSPGVIQLAHDMMADLCERYISMTEVAGMDKPDILKRAAVCNCIRKTAVELKRIGSKKYKSTVIQLRSFLVSKSVYTALDGAIESRDPTQLDEALTDLALFVELRSACKIRIVKQVLSLFQPATVEIETDQGGKNETNLDGLDDVALFQMLTSTAAQSFGKATADTKSLSSFSFTPITGSLIVLFGEFGKYCKPGKLARVLKESLVMSAISSTSQRIPPEWSILLHKLIMTQRVVPTLSRVFPALDSQITEGLSCLLNLSPDVKVLCDIMSLLQILLHGQIALDVCRIALSQPIYACLLRADLDDAEFTSLFERCSALLNDILRQPHLVSPQTTPCIVSAMSVWLIGILERSRQTTSASANHKALMIRNSSFVERLLGTFGKHRAFSKLSVHLIAVYCQALQNGALYPEAKEHIVAGLYLLLDSIDPYSRSMGTVTMGVESREIYKTLILDHQKFHKYRGLV